MSFEKDSTASKLENIPVEGTLLYELVVKLNCTTTYGSNVLKDSIMGAGQICDHDDSYLCEHRLEFILNFLNQRGVK